MGLERPYIGNPTLKVERLILRDPLFFSFFWWCFCWIRAFRKEGGKKGWHQQHKTIIAISCGWKIYKNGQRECIRNQCKLTNEQKHWVSPSLPSKKSIFAKCPEAKWRIKGQLKICNPNLRPPKYPQAISSISQNCAISNLTTPFQFFLGLILLLVHFKM